MAAERPEFQRHVVERSKGPLLSLMASGVVCGFRVSGLGFEFRVHGFKYGTLWLTV